MYRAISALIVKEFLAVLQDKKSRLVLILPPLLQLFVFAFAATLDVTNATIGVLNRDEGKMSYELIQRFRGSPTFTTVYTLQSVEQIETMIDEQKVLMVIHIDEQFSRNLLAGKSADVQLILDGRKSNTTQIVAGYAQQIVDSYNSELTKLFHLPRSATVLIPRSWFNPNLIYTWFTVPGLVGVLTMLICLLVTSLSIARERELGTFEQLLVSPLRPIDILIGKAIPGMVIGMAEGSLILLAAVLVFNIPFTGSLFALYLAMFCFVCSTVGIGLFLSSISKTQQQAMLFSFVFIAPAVILSGYATPVENMPDWLQQLTVVNPLRYFLVIIRGIFLKELPFTEVLSNIVPIILTALVVLPASTWFFRRRLD